MGRGESDLNSKTSTFNRGCAIHLSGHVQGLTIPCTQGCLCTELSFDWSTLCDDFAGASCNRPGGCGCVELSKLLGANLRSLYGYAK